MHEIPFGLEKFPLKRSQLVEQPIVLWLANRLRIASTELQDEDGELAERIATLGEQVKGLKYFTKEGSDDSQKLLWNLISLGGSDMLFSIIDASTSNIYQQEQYQVDIGQGYELPVLAEDIFWSEGEVIGLRRTADGWGISVYWLDPDESLPLLPTERWSTATTDRETLYFDEQTESMTHSWITKDRVHTQLITESVIHKQLDTVFGKPSLTQMVEVTNMENSSSVQVSLCEHKTGEGRETHRSMVVTESFSLGQRANYFRQLDQHERKPTWKQLKAMARDHQQRENFIQTADMGLVFDAQGKIQKVKRGTKYLN
jgi:hypothetical protein